jgi:hypothetical protein
MVKRGFDKLETWLAAAAVTTILIMIIGVFFALGFVNNSLYRALTPGETSKTALKFNIQQYNDLGLK